MQDEKSQIQNRAKALQVPARPIAEARAGPPTRPSSPPSVCDQIGGGGRSEKIRTYNYKENRVSDHRINLTTYNLTRC